MSDPFQRTYRLPVSGRAARILWLTFLLGGLGLQDDWAQSARPIVCITNVAGLRQSCATSSQIVCDVSLAATVCAVSRSGRELVLADDSGAELVMLDQEQNLQPGQTVLLTGIGCEVAGKSWGVALSQTPLVDNDGLHSPVEKSGKVFLNAGRVPLRLVWFNASQGRGLTLAWQEPGKPRQPVPNAVLFHRTAGWEATWTNGIYYRCFEGNWVLLPEFKYLKPVASGTVTNFTLDVTTQHDYVGLEFIGFLQVTNAGEHKFFLESDDGARLFIGEPPPKIIVTAEQAPPPPLSLKPGAALAPKDQFQWAEATGVVQQIFTREDCVELLLKSGDGQLRAQLVERAVPPSRLLLNSKVSIRGVSREVFRPDATPGFGLLEVAATRDIRVEQLAPELEAATPLFTVAGVLAKKIPSGKNVLRLSGTIRAGKNSGEFEITDGTNALPLVPALATAPMSGEVEAFGWLEGEDAAATFHLGLARRRESLAPVPAPPLPPMATAAQIERLSRPEAARDHPARLRGVITCDSPELYYGSVIQDQTRGIYFFWSNTNQPGQPNMHRPRLGEFWEIEGVTEPGQFAPVVRAAAMRRLGEGQLPAPLTPAWDQLLNGSLDTQFVEMQGIITETDTNGVSFLTHGGKLHISLPAALVDELRTQKNSLVRLRGCLLAVWDGETHRVKLGEIRLANVSVTPDWSESEEPFNVPQKSVEDLLLYDVAAGAFQRVKMPGQIVERKGEEFFMMNGEKGLRFVPREAIDLPRGERVEVAGIPELGGPSPILREAVVRRLGAAPLPPPKPLPPEQLPREENDATRVRCEALLNGSRQAGGEQILDLQAGGNFFSAHLPGAGATLPSLEPGSRVDVTGVYVSLSGIRGNARNAGAFELLLAAGEDVKIIARPPWWTLRRLLAVIGGLFAVLVLAALWITQLQRRVEERTAQLQREMHQREKAEQQRMVAEEKSRIARDLHDDLGSSLTEIGLQADVAQRTILNPAQATEQFGVIADKTRAMVSALDVIVWAVDPEENTLQATADYLGGYAEEFLAASGLDRRFKIPLQLPPVTVDGHTRHSLFLAVKEVLNNIVRHARADVVEFSIAFHEEILRIKIADNGVGFDLKAAGSGHGLANLQKRLEALGGKCQIESRSGSGTRIEMTLRIKA